MRNFCSLLFCFSCFVVSAQVQATIEKIDLNEKIYRSPEVDSKPQLEDGLLTLSAFIGNNYKFPSVKNKKVKIFTSFVVEPDGSMSDIRTFYISITDLVSADKIPVTTEEQKLADEKVSTAFKTEAVRVLSAFSEKWIPAKHQGKIVRCLYNYPLNFNIE